MAPYNPVPRTLWDLASSGQTTTISAGATSQRIDLLDVTDVTLTLYVTGSPTGTTPTLAAQIDVQDPDGNWIAAIAKTSTVNASGASALAFAGLHMPNVSTSSAAIALPRWCRIAWTTGGTNPVFPQVSISLVGR